MPRLRLIAGSVLLTGWLLIWDPSVPAFPEGDAPSGLGGRHPATAPPQPAIPSLPSWRYEFIPGSPGLYAVSASPMCFERGVGWVWDTAFPTPNFTVKAEEKRRFQPQRLLLEAGGRRVRVTWAEEGARIPFYTTPDTLGLLRTGQLYHFMWPLLTSLAAASALDSISQNPNATLRMKHDSLRLTPSDTFIPTYAGCPSASSWASYAWLGQGWAEASRRLIPGGCIGMLGDSQTRDATRLQLLAGIAGVAPMDNEVFSWGVPGGGGGQIFREVVCHRRGVAGGVDLRYYANRYRVTNGLFDGRMKCSKSRCRYRRGHLEYPDFFAGVRRRFHTWMRDLHNIPYVPPPLDPGEAGRLELPCRRVTIINRRGGRSFSNAGRLAAAGSRGANRSVSVVYFEDMPVLEQLRAVMGSDVVVGVHGSALAWCLLGAVRTVWVEVVPKGSGRSHVLLDSTAFAVDTVGLPKAYGKSIRVSRGGLEGYGVLTRYAASHHVSWYASCDGCTQCPAETPGETASPAAALAPPRWKSCNVTVPEQVFLPILAHAEKLRASPKLCQSGCYVPVTTSETKGRPAAGGTPLPRQGGAVPEGVRLAVLEERP